MEPTSNSFLEHVVRTPSQYSEGWRQICQELLDARACIKKLEEERRVPSAGTEPARLDADRTAKPKTEILAVHEADGKCIVAGHGNESYVVRPCSSEARADRLQNEVHALKLALDASPDRSKQFLAMARDDIARLTKENQRMAKRIGSLRKALAVAEGREQHPNEAWPAFDLDGAQKWVDYWAKRVDGKAPEWRPPERAAQGYDLARNLEAERHRGRAEGEERERARHRVETTLPVVVKQGFICAACEIFSWQKRDLSCGVLEGPHHWIPATISWNAPTGSKEQR